MTDHRNPDRKPTPATRDRTPAGLQAFAPWLHSTKPQREARRAAEEHDREERRTIAAHAADGPISAMYVAMGHSPDCAARVRGGMAVSCDCGTWPVDDPAVAIALALQCERFARSGNAPFPASIARLVEAGAERGDEACRMMLERLRRRRMIAADDESDGRSA